MKIKAQKGRGKKVHLLLDDEYVITTDIDFWAENYIADGTDISESEWLELSDKINFRKAYNKCADFLSRRDHSAKELKDKLLKTVDELSADRAIEKFVEMGYIDDEKYAVSLSKYLFENKNYSENHVRQELYKRGISKDIISDVLSENEIDEADSVICIINKNYISKLETDDGKEKVIAALMRKGFKYRDIKTAFYRIENEEYI